MSHADLTQVDHDLLVRIACEHALKTVTAAEQAVVDYAFFVRQEVERRVGASINDKAVVSDPDYGRVLDVFGMLGDAKRKLGEAAG